MAVPAEKLEKAKRSIWKESQEPSNETFIKGLDFSKPFDIQAFMKAAGTIDAFLAKQRSFRAEVSQHKRLQAFDDVLFNAAGRCCEHIDFFIFDQMQNRFAHA